MKSMNENLKASLTHHKVFGEGSAKIDLQATEDAHDVVGLDVLRGVHADA